ncbi:MAG: hypothetical protein JXR40_13440 [Pontiellaceae bacterium]|nr:hypothetical protein [Pontiellaceae bacterium]
MNRLAKVNVVSSLFFSMCLYCHSQEVAENEGIKEYKMTLSADSTTENDSATNTTFWTAECVLVIKNGAVEFQNPVITGIQNGQPISADFAEQYVTFFEKSSFRVVDDENTGVMRAEVEDGNTLIQLVGEALYPPLPTEELSIGDTWKIDRSDWCTDLPNVTLSLESCGIRPSFGVYECDISRSSSSELQKYSYYKSNKADLYGLHVYFDPKEKELIRSKVRSSRDMVTQTFDGQSINRTRFLITVAIERMLTETEKSEKWVIKPAAAEPTAAADEPKVIILKGIPPPGDITGKIKTGFGRPPQ